MELRWFFKTCVEIVFEDELMFSFFGDLNEKKFYFSNSWEIF